MQKYNLKKINIIKNLSSRTGFSESFSKKIVNDLIELSSTDTFNKHNRNDYAYDVSNAFKE